jgi:hypothetical protein
MKAKFLLYLHKLHTTKDYGAVEEKLHEFLSLALDGDG